MWDTEEKTVTRQCLDCHKHITEVNDCAHGEVSVWATSDNELKDDWSFRCEHCGITLDYTNLPHNVKIRTSRVGNAAQQSASRDH